MQLPPSLPVMDTRPRLRSGPLPVQLLPLYVLILAMVTAIGSDPAPRVLLILETLPHVAE